MKWGISDLQPSFKALFSSLNDGSGKTHFYPEVSNISRSIFSYVEAPRLLFPFHLLNSFCQPGMAPSPASAPDSGTKVTWAMFLPQGLLHLVFPCYREGSSLRFLQGVLTPSLRSRSSISIRKAFLDNLRPQTSNHPNLSTLHPLPLTYSPP